MKAIYAFLCCGIISSTSYAASNDRGVIAELYTDDAGHLAVKLQGGFPNSAAASECPTYNGWAGVGTVNSILKATLLAAKISQSPVLLSISGCEEGGAWLKITDVYIQ
jgi:hypothetical protein